MSYIRSSNPTATTRDIIGGSYIKPLTQPYTPFTSLPYLTPGSPVQTWADDIPDVYRTTLQVQIGRIDKTYFGDAIYGHRLSIVYDGSNQPVLYLNGVVQGTGTANADTISFEVSFPFCFRTSGPSSPACGSGETNILPASNVFRVSSGYTYAIVAGWDFTGRGMAEFHRRQLQTNRAAGNADNSEAVLGEALNMIGYYWLAQNNASDAVTDRIIGSKVVTQCAVGVVGQVSGPYIDFKGTLLGAASLTGDTNRGETTFFSGAGMGSGLEWATLVQNLARIGVGAVSTVKLINLANNQNDIIYDATSSNWSGVQPQLVGYSTSDFNSITSFISQGYRVVLPKHGSLTEGQWTGAGYIAISPPTTTGERRIVYRISTNLKGGFSTNNVTPGLTVQEVDFISPLIVRYPQFLSWDPIDLSSGGFLYDHDDLSVGFGSFPSSLSFRRSYNSNNLYQSSPLGPGWTHSFAINAATNSDGLRGLGQDSPIDGAAAIAAIYVIQDLFSDPAKPLDKMIVATLVQKWLMDRLINNTVNVTMGAQTEQFMLLTDGSYNPQVGSSSRLSLDNNSYTFRYKDATALAFDTAGNIATWRMPTGLVTSFAYDASTPPLLTSVSNGLGRVLSLIYDSSKRLTNVSDNASPMRAVSYAYDSAGNLASFRDPLGQTTTFAYTPADGGAPAGLLNQIFYPSNPTIAFVTNSYDSLGRITAQTSANGATWNYFFAGYRSEEDDPYGTQHVLYYNPRGKALFDIQDYSGLSLVTAMTYDGLDRLIATTLPEGGSTTNTYDAAVNPWANNVASVTRNPKPGSPLSSTTTSYLYDPTFNKATRITDTLGRVALVLYDSWTGNPISVTADAGTAPRFNAQTKITYNALGLVASTTDPMGAVTSYDYDSFGNRLAMTTDAGPGRLNLTTAYGYNARGDVVSVTDPKGNTTTSTYDDARRLVTATSPGGSAAPAGVVTANTYDADGRLLQVQQTASGSVLRTTRSTYTPSGKVATATDAIGNVTRYAYDLLDRQATLTDGEGRITQFTYDALSRPYRTYNTAIQPGPLLQQTYTSDGKLATLSDANGNTSSFAYDGFDRLATISYPLGSIETFTYDALDNQLSRKTRADDTITFTYDTLNRPITKTPPSGPVVTYTYDLNGRPTGVTDTSAAITAAVPPGGSTVIYGTTYAYDALNRLTGATWDPAPAAAAPAAGTLLTVNHSYNKVNQRTGQAVSDNTWLAYPLASASTTAYTANALNQYTAVGPVTPTYDGNGNLTSDGTYTLGYNVENRLVSASGAGNTAAYAFDAQGRRKSRTVNGTNTISVTDADNREVLEYDGSTGAILRWYNYALGPNAVLNQMNVAASTRATLVSDQLGSIIASFDSAAGAPTKFSYQPYGTAAAAATPFGFTGQRFDQESGLYYYRARHYSPKWGRFLQSDPVGYSAGQNLYAYVRSDPLNNTDPQGLDTYFGQVSAAIVSTIGAVANVGFYYTTNNSYGIPDVGLFHSAGFAVGVNVGVGVSGGFQSGTLADFRGRSISVDLSAGLLGGSITFTPSGSTTFNAPTGGSLGLNIGPAGASISAPTTKTFGLVQDIVVPMVTQLVNFVTPPSPPPSVAPQTSPSVAPPLPPSSPQLSPSSPQPSPSSPQPSPSYSSPAPTYGK